MSNSGSKNIFTFLAGLAIGVVAGILLAPEKGSETRKKILDKTSGLKDEFAEKLNELKEAIEEKLNKNSGSTS